LFAAANPLDGDAGHSAYGNAVAYGNGLWVAVGALADPPWFIHTTKQSEDLYFCDRVVEAGIPLFVDLDARLGHLAVFNIFPVYDEQWAAGISVSPSMNVVLPIVMPGSE